MELSCYFISVKKSKKEENYMTLKQAVHDRIWELCDERGITISNICGITQSTLNNIMNGRNNSVTLSTIKKICDGLEISLQDFFASSVFTNLEQEIK